MSMDLGTGDSVNFLADSVDPRDRSWTVTEVLPIDSKVSLTNAEAYIPKARTRASEQIRLHEMAHIAHTEVHEHDTERALQICLMLEEIRVDSLLLKQRALDVRNRMDDFDLDSRREEITQRGKLLDKTLEFLQFSFVATSKHAAPDVTKHASSMYQQLPGQLQLLVRTALGELIQTPTVDVREEHARIINAYFEPPVKRMDPEMKLKPGAEAEMKRQIKEEQEEEAAKGAQKKIGNSGELDPNSKPELNPVEEERLANPGQNEDVSFHQLGGAEIHDHISKNPMASHVKAPFTRTGRGLVPEFMEHWCTDKRVFRTEHRGGVIVLDCSGSMSPDYSQITKQMRDFPNLVVLSYQSVIDSIFDETTRTWKKTGVNGRICINAKGGRIDPNFRREPGTNGGNSVDYEALQYGAKFKGPRVWVSDGMAHGGVYDTNGRANYPSKLHTMIRELMHKEHYIRVENLTDALAWVTRSGPVEYHTAGSSGGFVEVNTNESWNEYRQRNEREYANAHTRKGRRG